MDFSTRVHLVSRNWLSQICQLPFSLHQKNVIWLHHRRLGHVSFSTLKIKFPTLFKGLDIQSFHCDNCEYAKHTRVSFPISNKISSSPFFLIHSDI